METLWKVVKLSKLLKQDFVLTGLLNLVVIFNSCKGQLIRVPVQEKEKNSTYWHISRGIQACFLL